MLLDFDIKQANAEALAHLRKESLDIHNRLHSIVEDVHFVNKVHEAYRTLPILPNLRCGAWYVDPEIATHEPAYFKSTDGHFGNWSFNLRRPNLHLLPLIITNRGLVLVDSTRAGKRLPDALSKTVPIWCAVINRAMLLLHPEKAKEGWDMELYCSPGAVSEQERSQIAERLDRWAHALVTSSYEIPELPLPLRPIWITPATTVFPKLPSGGRLKYIPVVCVSASKQVREGLERRSHGFAYVQGSGDDHELWGMGLNPDLFWKHKDELINTSRDDLPFTVASLLVKSRACAQSDTWKTLPTPISAVNGRILIGSVADMPSELPPSLPGTDEPVSFVVVSATPPVPVPPESPGDTPRQTAQDHHSEARSNEKHVHHLSLAEGKKDQIRFLQYVLPEATRYIKDRLARGHLVCVCCDTGRDASVGIALAALQLFFDAEGKLIGDKARGDASKDSIRTRLQWIISSRPAANPSRVTLKRVNEFLLTSPSFRRR